MRKLALSFLTSLFLSFLPAVAQSVPQDPVAIQQEIKKLQNQITELQGKIPQKYRLEKPEDYRNYIILCTPAGNVVEKWYDGGHMGYTTLQIYYPDGRPKLCDPQTGYPAN